MGTAYRELFKLYDLIQNGDTRAVSKFLANTLTDINTIIPCKGIGVLHLAVGIEPEDKSTECTEILLKHGGNPNWCNEDGVTPVHIAAIWGRVENIKLLIDYGGDPMLRDLDGMTARDYAIREKQWPVWEYLNSVNEVDEDLDGSEVDEDLDMNEVDVDLNEDECAYTLDLDKLLVTTDEVVAEYQLIPNDVNTTRTSERVRNWCANSLVVNKLYPTIIGETYLLDDDFDSVSLPLDKNITLDLTSDSFKTCLSRRSVEISGVQRLEITKCTCEISKRKSVYENFSLPGSPKNITHLNYNTKCSLRKKNDSLISSDRSVDLQKKMNELKLTDESLVSSDRTFDLQKKQETSESFHLQNKTNCVSAFDSQKKNVESKHGTSHLQNSKLNDSNDNFHLQNSKLNDELNERMYGSLDKAMAVVQNRTNEWFDKGANTRRSSASSGVSSNYSGGSIVIANIHEEYKYEDKEQNVVLIEKRLRVSPVILPVDEASDGSADQTVLSIASSLPTSVKYDDVTIRTELLKRGHDVGPIQDSTRTLYLKVLKSLKRQTVASSPVVNTPRKAYSYELKKSLRSEEWMDNLAPYIELEKRVRADFADPHNKGAWREGRTKTSFTYLLLDPRASDNLPAKHGLTKLQEWTTFVNSIFYVGKGKRSRPYQHLYDALHIWQSGKSSGDARTGEKKKIQHILDIWKSNVGVVCLHIYQNVIPAEAFTNEAAMISAMGTSTLTNSKKGSFYGVAKAWPLKEQRMLGLYLLYKAMQIFINEGERQLRPDDLK